MGKERGKSSEQTSLSLGAFKIAHRRIFYCIAFIDWVLFEYV